MDLKMSEILSLLSQLKSAINEYETFVNELSEMSKAWNSDDECARATSDPGLQFQKENDCDEAKNELLIIMDNLSKILRE